MATFTGNVNVNVTGTLSNALDIGSAAHSFTKSYKQAFANGTAADQANAVYTDTRTVGGSADDDIDLAGILVDGLGSTITFTSIKGIIINSVSANGDALHLTDDGAAGFFTYLGATGDIIKIRPGGTFALVNPEADGYAVTATTGDILRITNADSSSATYDIILIGEI